MISNFNSFGIEHLFSLLLPIIFGVILVVLANKYPNKKKIFNILFATTIITIRSVRYIFDISINDFEFNDLISLHICNIDLYILLACLFKPNNKLFTFTFLVGIPTALAVALFPGKIHPEPGMLRAIFFIMSHMLLVIAPIYLLLIYKYIITLKELIHYYMFSLFGIIIMYTYNIFTNSNYMYLIEAPKKTLLEVIYNYFGPLFYIVVIYLILIVLITILFIIYKVYERKKNK